MSCNWNHCFWHTQRDTENKYKNKSTATNKIVIIVTVIISVSQPKYGLHPKWPQTDQNGQWKSKILATSKVRWNVLSLWTNVTFANAVICIHLLKTYEYEMQFVCFADNYWTLLRPEWLTSPILGFPDSKIVQDHGILDPGIEIPNCGRFGLWPFWTSPPKYTVKEK